MRGHDDLRDVTLAAKGDGFVEFALRKEARLRRDGDGTFAKRFAGDMQQQGGVDPAREGDGNAPERPEACEQVMVFLSEGFAAHEDSRVETAMCQGVRMRQLLRDAVSFRPAPLPR